VAAIVSGVASIVIGQVGGACRVLVDNVIPVRTIRGAGTVSGHDGQTFLEKIRRQASIFFSFALPLRLDLISWMGKDPPAIT